MPPFYNAVPHICGIMNQGFGESKEKKTPFLFLEFEPLAESVAGNIRDIDGKFRRTVKLYLTDKTVPIVRKRLAALGWEGTSFRDLEPSTPGFHSFAGSEVLLECSHKGGFEEWEFPYDGPAAEPKKSDASLGRKLDALFGKSAATPSTKPATTTRRTTRAPAGTGTPPAVDPNTPAEGSARAPVPEGDIPF